jgi:hypothetical protein
LILIVLEPVKELTKEVRLLLLLGLLPVLLKLQTERLQAEPG